ncbi:MULTISPECIES: DUF3572 domain-containing protein [unclassified Ruegeria]|uniref:DUF3572 domain-containing protein n=1 Tax=unclassified Ruegeria TaxID=2625375 RepID=UPI001487D5F6|nr:MULTISPECIES: DUF3572 domain-containing protein [unclassified Ruegeria]NOD74848.1 DUF3572 family protein [Ruegeria sp. HKCCD4332]NOD86799.1 DUF3572 family protein [Ruegeria sp. HKCCD4318]NOE12354.1 DUF3572 family protein [Ruegeria sp. HKCCD4318-2]NOG09481.1 DUF3572 domain-containing protein [Ruegeria sp. HKCCD4315]
MSISSESAETLALTALGWLAGNEELFPVFLGSTGASVQDVRERAADPEFLASVLDFLVLDDSWVMAFCDANALAYDLPAQARTVLSGGADVYWT